MEEYIDPPSLEDFDGEYKREWNCNFFVVFLMKFIIIRRLTPSAHSRSPIPGTAKAIPICIASLAYHAIIAELRLTAKLNLVFP